MNNPLIEDEDSPIFDQLAQQEEAQETEKQEAVKQDTEVNISSAAASVFSDMEADIRKSMPPKDPAAGSHGPHGGATNLTKDELSDFFNAQQEENTPHTKEIAANPPKTNRAAKKDPYVNPSDLLTAYKERLSDALSSALPSAVLFCISLLHSLISLFSLIILVPAFILARITQVFWTSPRV